MTHEREEIFQGHIINLVKLDRHWEVVEHPGSVAILVADGPRVLGVRQRRPALDLVTWELPAGLIDPGETPLVAAERELAEEANLRGRLELVTMSYTSPGFSDEHVHLYEAHDVSFAAGALDDSEELEVEWCDAAELWAQVRAGTLASSTVTLLGIRHALTRLEPALHPGAAPS